MAREVYISKRKDVIKFLKRYYMNKDLTIQVVREDDPIAYFDSEFDDILHDYSYHIHILKPRPTCSGYQSKFTPRKNIEVGKKLYKKIRSLIPVLDNEYSDYISVDDFIVAITTRADIIDTILTDLLVDENSITPS